ncbi:hypothetical protein [Ammoniphilus sp. 3BR4]|uniref:hypothetical protein n=1 Tax=Ammoniphilus sp. 3BR4 TaxID=3158265 RepID=UPI0034672AA0
MKYGFKIAILAVGLLAFLSSAGAVGNSLSSSFFLQETISPDRPPVLGAKGESTTEIARYRSGRRSYRPAPGYQTPVRTTPPARYNAPRRTGGFLGGLGGFMAGAFLGSMFFGPLFGGMGHFTFLGLFVDLILISLFILFIRRIWTRGRERH